MLVGSIAASRRPRPNQTESNEWNTSGSQLGQPDPRQEGKSQSLQSKVDFGLRRHGRESIQRKRRRRNVRRGTEGRQFGPAQ